MVIHDVYTTGLHQFENNASKISKFVKILGFVKGSAFKTIFLLKRNIFSLDSVPTFMLNMLSWSHSIELVTISGHLHECHIRYKTKDNTNHLQELYIVLYLTYTTETLDRHLT
jgi:hypothetical protein